MTSHHINAIIIIHCKQIEKKRNLQWQHLVYPFLSHICYHLASWPREIERGRERVWMGNRVASASDMKNVFCATSLTNLQPDKWFSVSRTTPFIPFLYVGAEKKSEWIAFLAYMCLPDASYCYSWTTIEADTMRRTNKTNNSIQFSVYVCGWEVINKCS